MGAYILEPSDQVQIITTQHHVVPHTRSTLVIKGLLCCDAQAQYHGTIRIEKDARGSSASQENKNILWDGSARVVSVPNLEVLTHDVQCFHGSATGKFDEEQLFYAASRGIDNQRARRLLAQAFFANIFTDEMLKKQVTDLIG
jgi:Fe-S cluster assembly protein SufD